MYGASHNGDLQAVQEWVCPSQNLHMHSSSRGTIFHYQECNKHPMTICFTHHWWSLMHSELTFSTSQISKLRILNSKGELNFWNDRSMWGFLRLFNLFFHELVFRRYYPHTLVLVPLIWLHRTIKLYNQTLASSMEGQKGLINYYQYASVT